MPLVYCAPVPTRTQTQMASPTDDYHNLTRQDILADYECGLLAPEDSTIPNHEQSYTSEELLSRDQYAKTKLYSRNGYHYENAEVQEAFANYSIWCRSHNGHVVWLNALCRVDSPRVDTYRWFQTHETENSDDDLELHVAEHFLIYEMANIYARSYARALKTCDRRTAHIEAYRTTHLGG